ncbi:MAG: PfaB family protein [Candidatus Promineifilaceae bacterium]
MGVAADTFFAPNKGTLDKYYCLNGGYIRDFHFDPNGYRLPANYIANMDSLFQWSLYVARQALADAGVLSEKGQVASGKQALLQRTGVVLGNLSFPTQRSHELFAPIYEAALEPALDEVLDVEGLSIGEAPPLQPSPREGRGQKPNIDNIKIAGYPAGFVSQALGLGGAQFALDAACASSLYAVKLASQYLLAGKTDLMIAGAVSRADPFFINMGFSIFHAYPEGDVGSAPLNQNSGGLFAGEGAGAFVLKRHSDAVRDGDHIYAVISGVGLSNDGKGKFLLQPNPKGQILAFERAYNNANIDPASIDYVECHATGTPVGDITELNSMESFFTRYGTTPLIGSAKSNFGHLLTAAGMAGMTKVVLGMAQQQLPATINITNPLTSKGGTISGDNVVTEHMPWPRQGDVARAGVSAFGFGGTNAHLVLEHSHQPAVVGSQPVQPKMAIVGMDAFFGGCDGLDAFGRTIHQGKQQLTEIPSGRWQGIEDRADFLANYSIDKAPQGAFITDFDMDFFHFKIPPNNDQPIPQQLLILKVADRALRDAGIVEGQNVAVIVATGAELALHRFRGRVDLTWQLEQSLAASGLELTGEQSAQLEKIAKNSIHEPAQVNQYTSFIGNIMASRISSMWDFSGPAFTLSAENNATFKALEVAQLFLADGDVDAVVVGAVDLAGNLENVLLRHQKAPVNSGAASLSYDENANGWLIGEGAGVVVLKRHDDATAANDRIYATIDAVSVTQNPNDVLSVSAQAIEAAAKQALETAQVEPSDVDYIEVMGSGVAAEDSAEIAGLANAYASAAPLTTAIGSVKANIGHTFAASGIASLIKMAHSVYHRTIPATPNWTRPKSAEAFQSTPFYIPTESRPWLVDNKNRVAAINSLGGDGSYAHLLLSGEDNLPISQASQLAFYLFPVRANSEAGLRSQLATLQQTLSDAPTMSIAASQNFAAFQSHSGAYTLALVGHNLDEVLREIELALKSLSRVFASGKEWKTPAGSYFTPQPQGKTGKVAFVYPGAFSAYPQLGKDLFYLFPQLHASLTDLVGNSAELLAASQLYPRTQKRQSKRDKADATNALMKDSIAVLQASATYSTLATMVMRDAFSLQPDIALGYSLGEMTMMYATGVWAVTDNASEKLKQSPLFENRLSGEQNAVREFWGLGAAQPNDDTPIWAIALLKTTPARVKAAIASEPRVYLTHINTPDECVIGGDPLACVRVIEALKCDFVPAPYSHVIHCEPMRSERQAFVEMNRLPISADDSIDFMFAAQPQTQPLTSASIAENIATSTTQRVDFPALIQRAYDKGARIFIELGPRSACKWWVDAILTDQAHLAVAIDRRSKDDHTMLITMLAQLVSHQVDLDLATLYAPLPVAKNKPKLVRTVSLTSKHIWNEVVSAENRALFKDIKRKKPAPVAAIVGGPPPLPPMPKPTPIKHPLPAPTAGTNGTNNHPIEQSIPPSTPPIAAEPVVVEQTVNSSFLIEQLRLLQENQTAASRVHEAFLRGRRQALLNTAELLRGREQLIINDEQLVVDEVVAPDPVEIDYSRELLPQDLDRPNNYTIPDEIIWDRDALIEYAGGSIVPMFGEEFAIIDSYSRRVRLPMLPYLLVDRITKLKGKTHVYEPSTMTTEYDIPFDAWYSTDGQIPWAVSVESGQCDLLLISYLGIDFQNKGDRVYRLLDCTLTFLEDMPLEGHTLRYDISINSFAQSGGRLLFFFSYNCYVGDTMVLKMRNGCAGFFTDEELAGGKGIIHTQRELAAKEALPKQYFAPPLACERMVFDKDDLLTLSQGDIATVFGSDYAPNGLNPSLRMPPPAMLMVDRISKIDIHGGSWGLGIIESQIDLEPDSWFFPCHFLGDEVMAGSLVAEGCCQLLQFYLLYLGMQTKTTDARFQPIKNLGQVVRTRKQIMAASATLTYRMEITEVGLDPMPYAKANVDIIYNGIVVVDFKNLGLQLVEKTGDDPFAMQGEEGNPLPVISNLSEETDYRLPPTDYRPRPALYNDDHIENFALGSISACFGPDYQIFEGKRIPRTPNGDLKLFNRIVEINCERHKFTDKPNLVSEYDVPVRAWYYEQNSYPTMPYSVLMEIALQPCGFLSAYLGSTLPYPDTDFFFRNLDGHGTMLRDVDVRGKTISNSVTLLSATAMPGIVIQKFSFVMSVDGEPYYEGEAVFGYFEGQSLVNQVGLDQGKPFATWLEESGTAGTVVQLPKRYETGKSWLVSAEAQLNFLDRATVVANGGRHGKGYVHAYKKIVPNDWFFSCHFYQDPVMPGSLGVEAILEAMQVFALENGIGTEFANPYFTHADPHKTVWMYRGQMGPNDGEMSLEVDITDIVTEADQITIIGDASLWKNALRIYHVKQVALRIAA